MTEKPIEKMLKAELVASLREAREERDSYQKRFQAQMLAGTELVNELQAVKKERDALELELSLSKRTSGALARWLRACGRWR